MKSLGAQKLRPFTYLFGKHLQRKQRRSLLEITAGAQYLRSTETTLRRPLRPVLASTRINVCAKVCFDHERRPSSEQYRSLSRQNGLDDAHIVRVRNASTLQSPTATVVLGPGSRANSARNTPLLWTQPQESIQADRLTVIVWRETLSSKPVIQTHAARLRLIRWSQLKRRNVKLRDSGSEHPESRRFGTLLYA